MSSQKGFQILGVILVVSVAMMFLGVISSAALKAYQPDPTVIHDVQYFDCMTLNQFESGVQVWYMDDDQVKMGYFKDIIVQYEVYEDEFERFSDSPSKIFNSKAELIRSLENAE